MAKQDYISKLMMQPFLGELHHLLWVEPGEHHGIWDEGWSCRNHALIALAFASSLRCSGAMIYGILETPDRLEGQNEYSTLQALGPEVAACSTMYYWPQEKRQHYGDKPGILHVKCAVADGRWLFLSSANLTEYAFSINMELGVLVTGGPMPRQVEENFERLIGMGLFKSLMVFRSQNR